MGPSFHFQVKGSGTCSPPEAAAAFTAHRLKALCKWILGVHLSYSKSSGVQLYGSRGGEVSLFSFCTDHIMNGICFIYFLIYFIVKLANIQCVKCALGLGGRCLWFMTYIPHPVLGPPRTFYSPFCSFTALDLAPPKGGIAIYLNKHLK